MYRDLSVLCKIISKNNSDGELFPIRDWETLVSQAKRQGVAPLVYWNLSQAGKLSHIPETARKALRAEYAMTLFTNQQLFSQLETLSRHFKAAGIPIVALKGACFALTLYPDIGLRPMSDLDVLVPEALLPKAIKIATELGYKDLLPEVYPGIRSILKQEVELFLNGSRLELHNNLLVDTSFTFSAPTEWFWKQATLPNSDLQARFEGLQILSPEANILYLAAHTVLKHSPRRAILRQFYDLDQVIRQHAKTLDWAMMLKQAKTFEWSSALFEAFSTIKEYFTTPVPEDVMTALAQTTDRHQKLIEAIKINPETRTLEEYQVFLASNWYGKVLLVCGLLLPSPAYMRWRYKFTHFWELPLWYLRRWLGIMKDLTLTLTVIFKKTSNTNL